MHKNNPFQNKNCRYKKIEITDREYNTIINKSLLVEIDVTLYRIKLLLKKMRKLFAKLSIEIIFDKEAKRD